MSVTVPYTNSGFDLTAVVLDIKTASATLDVTVTAVSTIAESNRRGTLNIPGNYEFTFSGSAAATGRQILALEDPALSEHSR